LKNENLTETELRLGRRIAELRVARGLTQDKLAAAAGFTKGYLSKVEHSKAIPPIGTLVKIARVLNADVSDLLEAEPTGDDSQIISIVRSWQRESVIKGESSFGYDYSALAHTRFHKHMEPFLMVLPSEIDSNVRFEHEGEEFMFILSGEVELEVILNGRAKTWILSPGDSAYFDSHIPHRGRSLKGESRALLVISSSKDGAAQEASSSLATAKLTGT
jgi:transcriptional regulator with XRE-family HTH domain